MAQEPHLWGKCLILHSCRQRKPKSDFVTKSEQTQTCPVIVVLESIFPRSECFAYALQNKAVLAILVTRENAPPPKRASHPGYAQLL